MEERALKLKISTFTGGHSSEMIRLLKKLDKDEFQPRQYIVAQTDNMSKLKIEEYERKGVGEGDANNQNVKTSIYRSCLIPSHRLSPLKFRIFSIPRSREVHQSYISTVFSTLKALRVSMSIIKRELPDLVRLSAIMKPWYFLSTTKPLTPPSHQPPYRSFAMVLVHVFLFAYLHLYYG